LVRLVVLAGCRTAVGRIRRGEGVVSLASGFVAAGVPNVVATLWDLDDEAGRELFTEFHRAIVAGATPTDALRRAQLRLLRAGAGSLASPSAWAGVHAIATAIM
jgi:CHAT domain-containing protein